MEKENNIEDLPAFQTMKRKELLKQYLAGEISREEWLDFKKAYLERMKKIAKEAWAEAEDRHYAHRR